MKTLALFNITAGAGTTTLVYNLAHLWAELGLRVLMVDLDPQATLTVRCVPQLNLAVEWSKELLQRTTIAGDLERTRRGQPLALPPVGLRDGLDLWTGDRALAGLEDTLALDWARSEQPGGAEPTETLSLKRAIEHATRGSDLDLVLLDLGPNLSALNRAALLAADHVLLPLSPDLLTMQGLRILGPTLDRWQRQWTRLKLAPAGAPRVLGYVQLAHEAASGPWGQWAPAKVHIPQTYRDAFDLRSDAPVDWTTDPLCLGGASRYPSLMPLALDAHKPMFQLKFADGAHGTHARAVLRCREELESLARAIATRAGLRRPG